MSYKWDATGIAHRRMTPILYGRQIVPTVLESRNTAGLNNKVIWLMYSWLFIRPIVQPPLIRKTNIYQYHAFLL
jgi:hypothetical protein